MQTEQTMIRTSSDIAAEIAEAQLELETARQQREQVIAELERGHVVAANEKLADHLARQLEKLAARVDRLKGEHYAAFKVESRQGYRDHHQARVETNQAAFAARQEKEVMWKRHNAEKLESANQVSKTQRVAAHAYKALANYLYDQAERSGYGDRLIADLAAATAEIDAEFKLVPHRNHYG